MPGLYLLALLASLVGVGLLDRRFGLALWRDRRTTVIATVIGTVFFLAWDAVGIATGVFVKGDSALLLGLDLAPHLPVEEPVFLLFLSYLALVLYGAAGRMRSRREGAS
ncbi:lycopene cyclase domain-containing protein [Microbacterium thalli]|uniref:Lycopene cyclase domain-containing protein n=1 Tax=Microbacterium thalli TaxID=3027921 RepID=A0ABT5SIG2_9MICO|nr:lycopene cyclase domain-containing protein [Microbacterium thalli]MDD7929954.1 lycopene cyclase domain-containing protein [Microbacterium thalli]MDD7962588.1 lycopene cyclase domain-containing protein [Microbacterium thalli]MDN8548644.1 lycopene cyclase domain-containing protein [Microbacterium thalli]